MSLIASLRLAWSAQFRAAKEADLERLEAKGAGAVGSRSVRTIFVAQINLPPLDPVFIIEEFHRASPTLSEAGAKMVCAIAESFGCCRTRLRVPSSGEKVGIVAMGMRAFGEADLTKIRSTHGTVRTSLPGDLAQGHWLETDAIGFSVGRVALESGSRDVLVFGMLAKWSVNGPEGHGIPMYWHATTL